MSRFEVSFRCMMGLRRDLCVEWGLSEIYGSSEIWVEFKCWVGFTWDLNFLQSHQNLTDLPKSHLNLSQVLWISPQPYSKILNFTHIPPKHFESHLNPTKIFWISPKSHPHTLNLTSIPLTNLNLSSIQFPYPKPSPRRHHANSSVAVPSLLSSSRWLNLASSTHRSPCGQLKLIHYREFSLSPLMAASLSIGVALVFNFLINYN